MANLSFSEKQLIEIVFEMESGYVLDFKNNRIFSEFMQDVVQYDVFQKYTGLSKAKIIRGFIKDESNAYVGKLIIMLIKYMDDNNLITEEKREKVKKLSELGNKFLGKNNQIKSQQQDPEKTKVSEIDFENLKTELLAIENILSPQAKGYAFEKYINGLFKSFNLDPHASYRTEYDQIDGSFVLEGSTILIEAKYRSNIIPKDDLILFSNKIESKSHFPKGLFITYSPVDTKAIEYFTDKSARIVILTVEELFLLCQNKHSLPKVLQAKFRALDEKGVIYKHLMTII